MVRVHFAGFVAGDEFEFGHGWISRDEGDCAVVVFARSDGDLLLSKIECGLAVAGFYVDVAEAMPILSPTRGER